MIFVVDGRCRIFVSRVQWIESGANVAGEAGDVDVCMCDIVYLLAIIQIINRK